MSRPRDEGIIISQLARDLTPEQLAEMLALAYMTTADNMGSAHQPTYQRDPVAAPLFHARLMRHDLIPELGKPPRKTRGFGWVSLTKRGWLVLLSRCETDLQRLGAIPPEPTGEAP